MPRPHATPEQNDMFERPVTFCHGDDSTSPGRIDEEALGRARRDGPRWCA